MEKTFLFWCQEHREFVSLIGDNVVGHAATFFHGTCLSAIKCRIEWQFAHNGMHFPSSASSLFVLILPRTVEMANRLSLR